MKRPLVILAVAGALMSVLLAVHQRASISPSVAPLADDAVKLAESASLEADNSQIPFPQETSPDSTELAPTPPATDADQLLHELRALARKDAKAAIERAMKLSNEKQRRLALEAICYTLAEKDAGAAVHMARELELHKPPATIIENLVQQWAERDLSSAHDWASRQPPGEKRDELMSRIAFIWSKSAPSDAARFVVEEIPAGSLQTEAAITVLHQWAIHDLAAAARWVELFPQGPLRSRAITELAGITNERDELMPQPQ